MPLLRQVSAEPSAPSLKRQRTQKELNLIATKSADALRTVESDEGSNFLVNHRGEYFIQTQPKKNQSIVTNSDQKLVKRIDTLKPERPKRPPRPPVRRELFKQQLQDELKMIDAEPSLIPNNVDNMVEEEEQQTQSPKSKKKKRKSRKIRRQPAINKPKVKSRYKNITTPRKPKVFVQKKSSPKSRRKAIRPARVVSKSQKARQGKGSFGSTANRFGYQLRAQSPPPNTYRLPDQWSSKTNSGASLRSKTERMTHLRCQSPRQYHSCLEKYSSFKQSKPRKQSGSLSPRFNYVPRCQSPTRYHSCLNKYSSFRPTKKCHRNVSFLRSREADRFATSENGNPAPNAYDQEISDFVHRPCVDEEDLSEEAGMLIPFLQL